MIHTRWDEAFEYAKRQKNMPCCRQIRNTFSTVVDIILGMIGIAIELFFKMFLFKNISKYIF
jgi:hypothetical protein